MIPSYHPASITEHPPGEPSYTWKHSFLVLEIDVVWQISCLSASQDLDNEEIMYPHRHITTKVPYSSIYALFRRVSQSSTGGTNGVTASQRYQLVRCPVHGRAINIKVMKALVLISMFHVSERSATASIYWYHSFSIIGQVGNFSWLTPAGTACQMGILIDEVASEKIDDALCMYGLCLAESIRPHNILNFQLSVEIILPLE